MPVAVPEVVPKITIVAPGKGSPKSSNTIPLILPVCANVLAVKITSAPMIGKNYIYIFSYYSLFEIIFLLL